MTRTSRFLGVIPVLAAALLAFSGCSPQTPPEGRGAQVPRSLGKADGTASCEGICGQKAPAGCWCDDQCALYDDCCTDKAAECDVEAPSCEGILRPQAPLGLLVRRAVQQLQRLLPGQGRSVRRAGGQVRGRGLLDLAARLQRG